MRIWGQGEVGEVTSGQVPEEQQGTTMFCQGRTRVCSVKTLQISLDTECLDTEGDDTATLQISLDTECIDTERDDTATPNVSKFLTHFPQIFPLYFFNGNFPVHKFQVSCQKMCNTY